jgi:formamidopyrimidine-DNA glycosylase
VPELPEVETVRRGIAPHCEGRRVRTVRVHQARLRWPVPHALAGTLARQTLHSAGRRAKYLLLRFDSGTLLLHLGMTGSLRVLPADTPRRPHDHVDIEFDDGQILRFHDPRRFGSLHWVEGDVLNHPLLRRLGPEPLAAEFNGVALRTAAARRRVAVKPFLMNSQCVSGVGNIYANEALFRAGINPRRGVHRLRAAQWERLAGCIREVLTEAIAAGGSTLRDYSRSDGTPGYFQMAFRVYGREGQPCLNCETPLRGLRQGQRATVYCPRCQT